MGGRLIDNVGLIGSLIIAPELLPFTTIPGTIGVLAGSVYIKNRTKKLFTPEGR